MKKSQSTIPSLKTLSLSALTVMSLYSLHNITLANDIPNYIGQQTFRLSDDRGLIELEQKGNQEKIHLAQLDLNKKALADHLATLEDQRKVIADKMTVLQNEVKAESEIIKVLIVKLEELKKDPAKAEEVKTTQKEIDDKKALVLEKNKALGALKLESAPINVKIDQVRNQFNIASKQSEESQQRLNILFNQKEQYRADLIKAISFINQEGARVAQVDGSKDGYQTSRNLGMSKGQFDGQQDGLAQGTIDGQDRFYRRGAEQGERDGSGRARLDAERDGNREGVINGNKNAGVKEGRIAGEKRAIESDAVLVGKKSGEKAGLDRATKTGQIQGRDLGESESIKSLESDLPKTEVQGPFAGSFTRKTPAYPGDFTGPNYRPQISHSNELMRIAYTDGYQYTYRQYIRYEFSRTIDAEYNQAFDQSFRDNYNAAVSRDYPQNFEEGKRDADRRAYERDYPIIKANVYKIAFEQTSAQPNRSSEEYSQTFRNVESSTFNSKYEEIKSAQYIATEQETFKNHIAEQTNLFRQKRKEEVSSIYQNYPILQFIGSDIKDAGISGVGVQDGIFQPKESIAHNILINNFGFKEATQVVLQINEGAMIKLPTIPPRSSVRIKGAALSTISTNVDSSFKTNLKIISPLASRDSLQGRHFDSSVEGILKANDSKIVRVEYPIQLSNLGVDNQLIRGLKGKLKIVLENVSKREHRGEIKVKVTSDSHDEIVVKEFMQPSSLPVQRQTTLSDAEILVNSENDTYRDLSITAEVSINGVIVGELKQPITTMVKSQYAEKNNAPVVIANSNSQLGNLLDTISSLGGIDKVSVLDLSLPSQNAKPLAEGLSKKIIVLLDDSEGKNIKSLNTLVTKSKEAAFLMLNESASKNLEELPALKGAQKLLLDKRSVVFTNPMKVQEVQGISAFIQTSRETFSKLIKKAQLFTLNSEELMTVLPSVISPDAFGIPNDTLKILSLRSLAEILNVNMAYDKSCSFLGFGCDKKIAKLIKEDANLIHNQIKAKIIGDADPSKVPYVLTSIALEDTLNNAMDNAEGIYNVMTGKIEGNVEEILTETENSLKSNFKQIYNKVRGNASIHRPFIIDGPAHNF